jgi:hypothetical protein
LARADPAGAQTYEALLQRANDDPAIVAFWLGGSRGMGRPTEHSDFDCAIIVAGEAIEAFRVEFGIEGFAKTDWRPGVDLMLMSLSELERMDVSAANRVGCSYTFAHLRALVDKTGEAQRLIDLKGRAPPDAIPEFIHTSLDHALNQAYRGLKCLRDGDPAASRLEAAGGVNPFVDAVFALHSGRLRPFYKYLRWELETFPLDQLPFDGHVLIDRLAAVLAPDGAVALSGLLAATHDTFRASGHGGAYDGWGETLDWILTWRP